jgi:hypothetical protein
MRAVDFAVTQANQERDQKREEEQERIDHDEKHSGPDAERRVSLIRNILNKSED